MAASSWLWVIMIVLSFALSWFFEKVMGFDSFSIESIGARFFLVWYAMCTWVPLLADALHQSRDPGKKVK